jgi:hypothetical protein
LIPSVLEVESSSVGMTSSTAVVVALTASRRQKKIPVAFDVKRRPIILDL